jgi:pyridinium-3,5-bisthiocarboxylic acid mononucleotide nickel chelatase
MRIAYFDCFAGLSGEMLLGALVGAGLSLDDLRAVLAHLPVSGYRLDVQTVPRQELSGTYVTITEQAHNGNGNGSSNGSGNGHLQIGSTHAVAFSGQNGNTPQSPVCLIGNSDLPDLVKQTSLAVFRRLTQAEAAVSPHRATVSLESQQMNTLLTVVGVVAGLALLAIDRVECSPLHLGSGLAQTPNGLRPTLSPVAAEILRSASAPVYGSHVRDELVTPLGAAIITTITSAFGPVPAMNIASVGYGAGRSDLAQTPNLVRLLVGDTTPRPDAPRALYRTETGRSDRIASEQGPEPSEASPATAGFNLFFENQQEWTTLTIKGHQQSGRQRLADGR